MGYLKLQLEPNEDGTGELFANFEADGFSGHGSAWLARTFGIMNNKLRQSITKP